MIKNYKSRNPRWKKAYHLYLDEAINIYWKKEAMHIKLTQDEYQKKLNEMKNTGKFTTERMSRSAWKNGSWHEDLAKQWVTGWISLYTKEHNQYYIYSTNCINDEKNHRDDNMTGRHAIHALHSKFKELTGVSFKKAFGYVDSEFKRCVPKQFYYINKRHLNHFIPNISSVDFSSHYPSCACGRLPDEHTAIRINGTVAPTEEYPFAFYIRSGHLAEYNVFDTHKWVKYGFYKPYLNSLFRRNGEPDAFEIIPPKEDITILMKASKYEMTDCWKHFYAIRKQNPLAKLVMNASIGYMHTQTYKEYRLSHIAAIIIGRANQKMLNVLKKIDSPSILQVCVDGCMYIGNEEYGVHEKALGNLEQEYTGKPGILRNMNVYIVDMGDGTCKKRHGGFNIMKNGSKIDDKYHGLEEIYEWAKIDYIEEVRNGKKEETVIQGQAKREIVSSLSGKKTRDEIIGIRSLSKAFQKSIC